MDALTISIKGELAVVLSELRIEISAIQSGAESLASPVGELEQGMSHWSDTTVPIQTELQTLSAEVTTICDKCENLEGRSRRNNLRIIGVEESLEGPWPREFIAHLLKDLLKLDDKPLLDRAHRLLNPRPKQGRNPRPFIVRVLFSHLRINSAPGQTTGTGSLHYNGQKILLFPDYTAAVAKKRAAIDDFKRMLRGCKEVRYGFLFHARFRLYHNGTQKVFNTPEEAESYIWKNILEMPPAAT
ncbi:hypothetical protein AAFF_G00223200 [Aldrovandia affinis]|uniref:Uncharacterized protein n=1 Tax=Aldrovandia affinis TaxID=143900 RepID=A0AAD7W4N3_9TELE|nr:hypothetical protein AAFF_G00223200 [Aldrovandia affinis]